MHDPLGGEQATKLAAEELTTLIGDESVPTTFFGGKEMGRGCIIRAAWVLARVGALVYCRVEEKNNE
jgi:hypothetical protein